MGAKNTRAARSPDNANSVHVSNGQDLTLGNLTSHMVEVTPRGDLSLMTIDPETLPDVLFKDEKKNVYVYNVHDGDTVNFIMYIGNVPVKLALRLLGIDTPEIRGGQDRLPAEKTAGLIARDRLATLLGANAGPKTDRKPKRHAFTTIIIRDWDKFGGRLLGDIILPDGRSAAEVLLSEGYGRPYNGEKKQSWTVEDLSKPPFSLF